MPRSKSPFEPEKVRLEVMETKRRESIKNHERQRENKILQMVWPEPISQRAKQIGWHPMKKIKAITDNSEAFDRFVQQYAVTKRRLIETAKQ